MRDRNKRNGETRTTAAEITLAGYELLRLHPGQWRRLLEEVAGPAIRLHDLRAARTRLWRQGLCEIDCHGRTTKAGNHRE